MKNKFNLFPKVAVFIGIAMILSSLAIVIPRVYYNPPPDERPICTARGNQTSSRIISDSGTGSIIFWEDERDNRVDIYAKRIDENGKGMWRINGVKVCTPSNNPRNFIPNAWFNPYYKVIADGAGGAIIVWEDNRNGNLDIYAQKIDGNGSVQWESDGIPVCSVAGDEMLHNSRLPQIGPDGEGGVIVVWADQRNGPEQSYYDIYAQRLDTNGNTLWAPNGIPICTTENAQQSPIIIPSDNGGAFIAWGDRRNEGGDDIFAQKIDSDGFPVWQDDGIVVCDSPGGQLEPNLIPDGSGGLIIVFADHEEGNDTANILAQRINENGTQEWEINGRPISIADRGQEWPKTIYDENYLITAWYDHRSGTVDALTASEMDDFDLYRNAFDIYAQKIDCDGNSMWDVDGIPVCTAPGHQSRPEIVSDGEGGAIITWADERSGVDIYAQLINSNGIAVWVENGNVICNARGTQSAPSIIPYGNGGAIITWTDYRAGSSNANIFAQGVKHNGRKLWSRPIASRLP